MTEKKEDNWMMPYTEFIEKNKEKIKKLADADTKRNQDGIPVIEKDDPWRKETEWDELFKDLMGKS